MNMDMKKRYLATCPISYRPTNDCEQHRKNILGYIFSGYETCESTELRDVCLQTDLNMSDWDDQYFENIIERFTTGNDDGDSRPVEEFADVIESGDEEFHSVEEGKIEETRGAPPHSINIQLKDAPNITLEDGVHKTKISLTPKYLEQNGLELVIGEGPERNVRLKAGDAEIYPSDKVLPPGIIISVTDEKNYGEKDSKTERSHDYGENINHNDFKSPGNRVGLLSLVVDDLEQKNIEQHAEEKPNSYISGGNIVQCISDYGYLKEFDKREVGIFENNNNQTLGRIHRANAEMVIKKEVDPEMVKRQEKEMYKQVKKKFYKSVLEGDPRLDYVKRELIEELVRKGYEVTEKEKFKNTEVQTDVQIHPGASDDFSFSDDSDSIIKRFYALREFSTLSYSVRGPSQTKDNKEVDKNNTHDGTMGQIDSDFSGRTEFTMDGISDLTERTVVGILKEKEDATDDDMSVASTKPKKSHSFTSVEMRSKLTDTQGLEDDVSKDVAVVSDRQLKSPSLLKALRSFDEELNPLNQELSRLLSDFKSIDIPEDVQISVAVERLPEQPSTPVDSPSTSAQYGHNPDESIHHLYRTSLPHTTNRGDPCHCGPGTCLGFRRSSGIICQRIKRLPPSASSPEFFREFTRPSWMSDSFRPNSILSEPEDIYGDRVHRPPSSIMSIHNDDISNKPDSS